VASKAIWINPTVTELKLAHEGNVEIIDLRVSFVAAGSGSAPGGRLFVGTQQSAKFVLDLPLLEKQLARGRFGEQLSFPISDLSPEAQTWVRQVDLSQVHAWYR
jgi:hypothetical protein